MSNHPSLLDQLGNHHQQEQASCAVSGFECVAKLHGLLDTEEYPLQSDKTNQERGFDDEGFLASLGILPLADHHDIESALDLIETETSQGRFPLVSCISRIEQGKRWWHICLCGLDNTKLVLIDPAVPKILCEGREDLRKELEKSLFPVRRKIHMQTYTLETQ